MCWVNKKIEVQDVVPVDGLVFHVEELHNAFVNFSLILEKHRHEMYVILTLRNRAFLMNESVYRARTI